MSLYAAKEDREALIQSFTKIERRLGGQNLKSAVVAVENGDYTEAAKIALVYYDKTYDYNLENNGAPLINVLDAGNLGIDEIALRLRDYELRKGQEQ